jgi:hypothetical protein
MCKNVTLLAVVTNCHNVLLFSSCINLIMHSLRVGSTRMHYEIVDCSAIFLGRYDLSTNEGPFLSALDHPIALRQHR